MREGELAGVLGQDPEPGAGLALGCAANDAHRCAHDTAAHYYARAGEVREHIEADGANAELDNTLFHVSCSGESFHSVSRNTQQLTKTT